MMGSRIFKNDLDKYGHKRVMQSLNLVQSAEYGSWLTDFLEIIKKWPGIFFTFSVYWIADLTNSAEYGLL